MSLGRRGLFALAYRLGRILDLGAKALYATAVGTMRRDDLQRATERDWRKFGEQQVLEDRRFSLMAWEVDFYPRFLKPEDRILIVGCGTGRDLLALLERGYRVEGLDLSAACVATAGEKLEARGRQAPLYTGAIETIALPGRFDAFIFSWFCYGYIPESATRIAVLRKVKAHLNAGGRILISYIPTLRPPRRLPIHLTRIAGRLTGSDWRPEYGDVITPREPRMEGVHFEHHFGPGELDAEARAAGLTVSFHDGLEGTAVLVV